MLEELKQNFKGNLKLALKRDLDADLISPTTRAKFEWALEEIERLEDHAEAEYYRGYGNGYDNGYDYGVELGSEGW